MNPLPFFPPPSRSLSRINDKPPPSSGLPKVSTQSNRQPSSYAQRTGSLRNGTSSPSMQSSEIISGPLSSSSSSSAGGSSINERPQSRKTPPLMPTTTDGSSSPRSRSGSTLDLSSPKMQSNRRPTSSSATMSTAGGRLGTRLPPGLFFDILRPGEVSAAYRMEVKGYSQEDAASLETLRYRQKAAPHLFFGAYVPMAPPKVSGPLTMAGPSQRKLIGFACATASSALTARSMKVHSDDEHAWLVCLHSVCVAPEYQRKGVALKMIEEYMRRLRRAEEGKGGESAPKKGYECVALLAHEEMFPLYKKTGFKVLGVSHVNWGSGGWFEMRRYIIPRDLDEEGKLARKTSSPVESVKEAEPEATEGEKSETVYVQSPESSPVLPLGKMPSDEVKAPVTANEEILAQKKEQGAATGEATPASEGKADASIDSQFTSVQVLEALKKQSAAKAADEGSRNPGMAYATIVGQTLAGKTAVEDAFFALQSRLVDRETESNLAEIYCPREECACLLLRARESIWEMAELGPLASANLSLPNCPAPPTAPVPPPPSSLDRIRSALGSSTKTTTPIQAFWCVDSPMSFENIGFSKDDEWVPPSTVKSPQMLPSDPAETKSPKKPTKRGSLFRSLSDKRKEGRDKSMLTMTSPDAPSEGGGRPRSNTNNSGDISPAEPLEPVKVKYLLCADCDCGPIGYTVLPASLQNGKFAQEVGKTMEGSSSEPMREAPVYLLAADRVRYHFVKN